MSIMNAGTPQPGEQTDEAQLQAKMERMASTYFEKFSTPAFRIQELIGYHKNHWLLSDDFKMAYDQPVGLIKGLNPLNSNACVLMIPEDPILDENDMHLDYREVHQVIRELTYGIYVLNQTPSISLEALYDQGTSCNLPPAFMDTHIGQLLISVDYMMKSLWHGAYFPKEKRTKFNDKWREHFQVSKQNGKPEKEKSFLSDFTSHGMIDIGKDPDYCDAYNDLQFDNDDDPDMIKERIHFMKHVEDICMQMTLFQKKVMHEKDIYMMESDMTISSIVRLLDDRINHDDYERVNTRLQMHENMLRDNITKKLEIRRQLFVLKLVSFLTPFLIGMRKRMKIPDLTRFLPDLSEDQCKTEEELPPLMLGEDFKCKNFYPDKNKYFHLHGGINIDFETDDPECPPKEVLLKYSEILTMAEKGFLKVISMETIKEHYDVPKVEIGGKEYYMIFMEFETFFNPQQPLWIKSFNHKLTVDLERKYLPLQDTPMWDVFIKNFGKKKTGKLKAQMTGPRAAAIRGLVIVFVHMCRKTLGQQMSRLTKQDEHGLSLLHHAAMNNRPQIIVSLLRQTVDINSRRNNILSTGPTGLHIAARCGALDAAACLLACCAGQTLYDQDGWAPIHHAAFFDHESIIKLMARRNNPVIELLTRNDTRSTPLLLAASSGGLSAVKCLINLGADISRVDAEGNGMVNLAAMRFHTNVLEHLIEWSHEKAPVWKILVKMLADPDRDKRDSAVKCLEVLSTSKPEHWKSILEADGIPALVKLLSSENEVLQSVAASVVVNISEHQEIRKALTKAKAAPILIQLLNSPDDNIQSRVAIILSDIASIQGNQSLIADEGGIPPLINLMDSELEEVLINTVNAVRVLCAGNPLNQDAVAENGGITFLREFLTLDSEKLKAATAACTAAVSAGNKNNQDALLEAGALEPLVDIINGTTNETVRVKCANAIEALAQDNPACQQTFLRIKAPTALKKLLKNFNVSVKEHGAKALWALAGSTTTQQKYIAEKTSIPDICSMLLEDTEKLLQVGCMMSIALGRENIENQIKLAHTEAFNQLVRLLRTHKDSPQVILMVIQVLGILCVGVAYCNNKVTQRKIAEEGAIPTLVTYLNQPPSEEVQVEVAIALGCIVLSNTRNQELLQEEPGFNFDVLLDLLKSKSEAIRLRAGMALTIFAFNNTPQQYAIREAGGIKYSVFEPFLNSIGEYDICYAAFQIVVLARVIVDQDQVMLTARGVTLLVERLQSKEDNVIVLAASLLSSLAHTRAGIPDAMVTSGAIDILVDKLSSPNDQVRGACAVALGYLTFNRTAARILFSACRNTPGLYKKLEENIGKNAKISQEFVQDFKRAKIVGLPSQCLEINGGPPVIPPSRSSTRPMTGSMSRATTAQATNRVKSAPGQRGKRSPHPSVVVSTPNNSRPSTATTVRIHPTSLLRPSSATTPNRKGARSPDSTFKTRLSSWKEEI
ncbi:ankyrin and armadillo repeat-containing protein-like isoform X2 [Ostrea edulis]|uniref:ankyrin and armadillo repeat-containing protein-like isoform X2 n=1 Tax=Ostrea edulis TaxID=37623 RepID=UPI002095ED6C|nr:ankyrin and armadillo repeat-containing protein-like isoform X2 [Ostrea edulis]XP_056008071.1 ankyrin and armadillo repeat-containing protein-like isoform X2 [Ostrea edulis]